MSRAVLVLDSEFQRRKASDWAWNAKSGSRVEFKGPKRSLDQNSLFWVLLTEVATQLAWHGKRLTADDWKLMFLDALRREKKDELRIVPNTDNTGFVNLSNSSSDLSKDEMSEMIELILAFGAKHGVKFEHQSPAAPSTADDKAAEVDVGAPASAADNTASNDAADQAGGDESPPVSEPPASLSDDDREFLVRVFKTMKAAVGPDVAVFTNQAKIFKDEIATKSVLVKAKATKIRAELAKCCGDDPTVGTVTVGKYMAGLIGVDEKDLVS